MCPRAHAPQQETPPQWEACAPQLESSSHPPRPAKSPCSNEDSAEPKINKNHYVLNKVCQREGTERQETTELQKTLGHPCLALTHSVLQELFTTSLSHCTVGSCGQGLSPVCLYLRTRLWPGINGLLINMCRKNVPPVDWLSVAARV